MKYGTTHEVLKPLSEVTLPDPRFEIMVLGGGDDWRKFDVSDLRERIEVSALKSNVPQEVRRQFEIARNLMLYSWFVFEFHIVAEQHAYGSLERALRFMFPNETKTIRKKGVEVRVPKTLGPLLRKAKESGLVIPDKLPFWQRIVERRQHEENPANLQPLDSEAWFEHIIESLPDFRNKLAHGGFKLHLGGSFTTFEICADIINALFSKPDEKTTQST